MKITQVQQIQINHAIAEELFGWRWLSHFSRPVRSHPEYPKEMMVRRFFPSDKEIGKRWREYFDKNPHTPSTGDEPLDYCYESSMGPHMVPNYFGDANDILDMERQIVKRGLWDDYQGFLKEQVESENPVVVHFAPGKYKCLAALAAVGSKYVTDQEPPLTDKPTSA